jgi:hypothetical protein
VLIFSHPSESRVRLLAHCARKTYGPRQKARLTVAPTADGQWGIHRALSPDRWSKRLAALDQAVATA